MQRGLLFLVAGVEEDGDWAVVKKTDFHVSGKDSGLHGLSSEFLKFLTEGLVISVALVGWGGIVEAWAVALFVAGNKGELTDDEQLAVDVGKRLIHQSLGVLEDAQVGNLAGHPFNVGKCIFFVNTD